MKTVPELGEKRKFVPVVIQRLRETYEKQATNPHPMKTLLWYEILRDCFPQWGEEIMGIAFIRAALFSGDVEEHDPDIPERKTKRTSAYAHLGQKRKRTNTRRAKI
jgi:hypothetical protein